MARDDDTPTRVRWARLRFSIIGPLLASPADGGDLKRRIEELAAALLETPADRRGDPVLLQDHRAVVLRRARPERSASPRSHARSTPARARTRASWPRSHEAIARQHREHPRWSFQLHYDNLVALAREDPQARSDARLRDRAAAT